MGEADRVDEALSVEVRVAAGVPVPDAVADPVGEVAALYSAWGVTGVDRDVLQALIAPYLGGEEHVHTLGNATWAAMGVEEDRIAQLVRCPMLTYGHLNRAAAPASPQIFFFLSKVML